MPISLTRRDFVAGCAAFGMSAAGGAASAAPAGESLGALAARSGLLFGAAAAHVFEDEDYGRIYREQVRILSTNLALKFLSLRPDRGPPQFEEADKLFEFASHNGMAFRGHNLIWNDNNPDWLKRLRPAEVAGVLDAHIDETVGRYAGRMHSWDVVNEPFWPDGGAPGGFRKGVWYEAMGPGYIVRALRRAAAADPKAGLVINEAFTERTDALGLAVRAGLLKLIDDLQHQGVPLTAIGLEAHLQPQIAYDDHSYVAFLHEIARRGLDIYLTEFDIDDRAYEGDAAARDRQVADRAEAFLSKALSVPAVKVLQCWELSDRYGDYQEPERNAGKPFVPGRPLPYDRWLDRKPMYEAIARVLSARIRG